MSGLTIAATSSFFSKQEAIGIAAMLNGDCFDDWEYVPVHDPKGTGYSFIEIYDEDGEFVSKL